MSAALLNQDFGPESEDDDFNPAPAVESDDEAAGDSENENKGQTTPDSTKRRASSVADDRSLDARSNQGQRNGERRTQPVEDEDDDVKDEEPRVNGIGEDGEEEEGDEADEDDEDEEDAISVYDLANLSLRLD